MIMLTKQSEEETAANSMISPLIAKLEQESEEYEFIGQVEKLIDETEQLLGQFEKAQDELSEFKSRGISPCTNKAKYNDQRNMKSAGEVSEFSEAVLNCQMNGNESEELQENPYLLEQDQLLDQFKQEKAVLVESYQRSEQELIELKTNRASLILEMKDMQVSNNELSAKITELEATLETQRTKGSRLADQYKRKLQKVEAENNQL